MDSTHTDRGRRDLDSEARAREVLRSIPETVLMCDAEGRIVEVSGRVEAMLGYRPDELVGRPVEILVPTGLQAAHGGHRTAYSGSADAAVMGTGDVVAVHKDGSHVEVEVSLSPVELPSGQAVLATVRDVTEARGLQRSLRASEQLFRSAFDDAPIGMAIISLDPHDLGRLVRVNRALSRITGYPEEALVRGHVGMLQPPATAGSEAADHTGADRDSVPEAIRRMAVGELAHFEQEKRACDADGREVWLHVSCSAVPVPDGTAQYAVSQIQDATERKRDQLRLAHQALHDPLTGLPNRILLTDRLVAALARSRRSLDHVAVLFLDLDDFKVVNDTLGHDAGDEVLAQVAQRLSGCLRETDTAARLGGDEFVVVCEDLEVPETALLMAERVVSALRLPFALRGRTVTVTCSVGVSTSNAGSDAEELIRDADRAMYHAKEAGKCRYALAHEQQRWPEPLTPGSGS